MTSIGTVSTASTDKAQNVRDYFVDTVAQYQGLAINSISTDWTDGRTFSKLSNRQQRAIQTTIDKQINRNDQNAEFFTIQDQGNALWDANAQTTKDRLERIGVQYDILSDEARATIDAAANIVGPTQAVAIYKRRGQLSDLAQVVNNWDGGSLYTAINAFDSRTSSLAHAFMPNSKHEQTNRRDAGVVDNTSSTPHSSEQQTEISDKAKSIPLNMPVVADKPTPSKVIVPTTETAKATKQLQLAQQRIGYIHQLAQAATAGIEGVNPQTAARDMSPDDLSNRQSALETATQELSDVKSELAILKYKLELRGGTQNTGLIKKIDFLAENYPEITGIAESGQATLDAVKTSMAEAQHPSNIEERTASIFHSNSFRNSLLYSYNPDKTIGSGFDERHENNLNEYYGQGIAIPESFLRDHASELNMDISRGRRVRQDNGKKAHVVHDRDIYFFMRDDTNRANAENLYISHLDNTLNDALLQAGYTQNELSFDRSKVIGAYMHAMQYLYKADGIDSQAIDNAVIAFGEKAKEVKIEFVDIQPFVEPEIGNIDIDGE